MNKTNTDARDMSYVSTCESMWRISKSKILHQNIPVQKLCIHLPGQQHVVFNDSCYSNSVATKYERSPSMFTAFLEKNKTDVDARNLTYAQFPSKYVWNKLEHTWTKRKIGQAVGKLVNVHPSTRELYYLRILINHLKGPTSFEDILTVSGKKYNLFKESCFAHGLLEGEKEWHDTMVDAALWSTPKQLRQLFTTLLVHCEVASPLQLWNACWKELGEDLAYQLEKLQNSEEYDFTDADIQTYTLIEIEMLLSEYDRSLSDYPDLPRLDKSHDIIRKYSKAYESEQKKKKRTTEWDKSDGEGAKGRTKELRRSTRVQKQKPTYF